MATVRVNQKIAIYIQVSLCIEPLPIIKSHILRFVFHKKSNQLKTPYHCKNGVVLVEFKLL